MVSKREYEEPTMEIKRINFADIIVTSPTTNTQEEEVKDQWEDAP